jgi:hypothetical protein
MERLQELGDGDATGTVPEGAGEELPHADETAEDDVLLLGQPVRAEGLADAGAIEADRAVPHDLLKGGGLLGDEAGSRAGNELTITDRDPVSKQPHLNWARRRLGRARSAVSVSLPGRPPRPPPHHLGAAVAAHPHPPPRE